MLGELGRGARVGTGSPRRTVQLHALGQGLEVLPIRGNVDTRIGKVRSGELDAVVVAAAGLRRLGRVDEAVGSDDLLPAAIALAADVARRSPEAVAGVKRALSGGRAWREGIAREAAGFVAAASGSRAIARIRAFAAASTPDGSRTPWRDRTWLP